MTDYVVLLRGINVGGKNTVSMAALKTCLEALGCTNVTTYINSGNVLLESKLASDKLGEAVEDCISRNFTLDSSLIKVLVLTEAQLQAIVDKRPKGFGEQPDTYHSDVVFLMGITIEAALTVFKPREGVDAIWPGKGVVYSQRLSTERTKSRLGTIVGTKPYQFMTIRNWNTTTKLLSLMRARSQK